MRGIRHRFNVKRNDPDRDVLQGAQRRDAVKLGKQQRGRPRPPAERRLGDEELEPLAVGKQRQLPVEPGGKDLRDLLFQVRRLDMVNTRRAYSAVCRIPGTSEGEKVSTRRARFSRSWMSPWMCGRSSRSLPQLCTSV